MKFAFVNASGLRRHWELPDQEPVFEPERDKRTEGIWTAAIFCGWVLIFGLIVWAHHGSGGRTLSQAAWYGALGVGTWVMSEWLARRRGMIWPGSMLGLLGPISFAYALAMGIPAFRALDPLYFISVIYTLTSVLMLVYLFRFRLSGLVSPIVTFTIVSLFMNLKGADPSSWSQVEGVSPRGLLAAIIDDPLWMSIFGPLAMGCVIAARRLDLKGDYFGIQAARPLHLIGAGVVALVLGRLASRLPTGLDVAVLLLLFVIGFLWAMRVDRPAVMVAAWFAMTRSLILAVSEPLGITYTMAEWSALTTSILAFGFVLWGWLRMRVFVPIGWTARPRFSRLGWPHRVLYPPPGRPGHTDPNIAYELEQGKRPT